MPGAVREDTFVKAFLYAGLTAGLSTGLALEYRIWDPFKTYHSRKRRVWINVLQTSLVAGLSLFLVLMALQLTFGLGESLLALRCDMVARCVGDAESLHKG